MKLYRFKAFYKITNSLRNASVYIGSVITFEGWLVSDEIWKTRLIIANLRHLYRRYDIYFQTKGLFYYTTVRSILLYTYETWPFKVEDIPS